LTINSKDISKKVNFYFEALDDAKIEISQVNYPELVESNQVFNLSFTLVKKSYSVPKDIKVELQNLRKEALINLLASYGLQQADEQFVRNYLEANLK